MPRPLASSILATAVVTREGDVRRRALAQVEQTLSDQAALRTANGTTTRRGRRAKRTTRR